MILRVSTAAARAVLVIIGFLLAAALGYSSVCNALAAHYVGLDTLEGFERATRLAPSDAGNWYLLGRYWQYNLEDPNSEKAIAAYKKSLSLDPHSADTWSDLAMAYESEAEMDAARDAFLQAKRAYPLSPEVAWRYGNFLLRHGETETAFAEIRHAVEVDPKRGAAAFALGSRIEPDMDVVLDRVLPPSQQAYLSVLNALTDQQRAADALKVWALLMKLHPHLDLRDSNGLIDGLLQRNLVPEAKSVWDQTVAASGISPPPGPPGSLIWDGGFESNLINAGFTWRYVPFAEGVQIGRDSSEKHSGNFSLRLTFNGLRNVDFHEVCQFIPVQPSTSYRFSAWVQTRSLSTDQGVRFLLHSANGSAGSDQWTDDLRGTQPWTQIQMPWTSGPQVHQLHLCISRRPSAKFDSKIRGSAWIDDVALEPAPSESTPR
jgi:tetratricopeptide (TPR) repeat protein